MVKPRTSQHYLIWLVKRTSWCRRRAETGNMAVLPAWMAEREVPPEQCNDCRPPGIITEKSTHPQHSIKACYQVLAFTITTITFINFVWLGSGKISLPSKP